MILCETNINVSGRLIRIAHIDGDKYNFPDDPDALIESLKNCEKRIDLFTFLQRLPEETPKYSYPFEWDNLAVLPVSSFDHWWNHQIKSFPRNRARQAEKKGVVLREIACDETLIHGICAIYNESPIRQGKRFPHYGMTIERARDYARTYLDRSIYVGAFLDETMIGFVKLTMDKSRTHACMVHILSLIQHRDKATSNALLAHAVKVCSARGVSYLVYENLSYGKKQGDSLSHFKEVNGFRRMNLPRYYIPLTPLGWLAFRLGLHHKFADRLPESWLAKLREWRSAWYQRRFQLKTESL